MKGRVVVMAKAPVPGRVKTRLAITLAHAKAAAVEVELLPTCYDIDEAADLVRLLSDPSCPPAIRAILSR